jgi:hypothetical protein
MPTHGIEDENLCSFVHGMFSANMTATPVVARLHGPSYVAQDAWLKYIHLYENYCVIRSLDIQHDCQDWNQRYVPACP